MQRQSRKAGTDQECGIEFGGHTTRYHGRQQISIYYLIVLFRTAGVSNGNDSKRSGARREHPERGRVSPVGTAEGSPARERWDAKVR